MRFFIYTQKPFTDNPLWDGFVTLLLHKWKENLLLFMKIAVLPHSVPLQGKSIHKSPRGAFGLTRLQRQDDKYDDTLLYK